MPAAHSAHLFFIHSPTSSPNLFLDQMVCSNAYDVPAPSPGERASRHGSGLAATRIFPVEPDGQFRVGGRLYEAVRDLLRGFQDAEADAQTNGRVLPRGDRPELRALMAGITDDKKRSSVLLLEANHRTRSGRRASLSRCGADLVGSRGDGFRGDGHQVGDAVLRI